MIWVVALPILFLQVRGHVQERTGFTISRFLSVTAWHSICTNPSASSASLDSFLQPSDLGRSQKLRPFLVDRNTLCLAYLAPTVDVLLVPYYNYACASPCSFCQIEQTSANHVVQNSSYTAVTNPIAARAKD